MFKISNDTDSDDDFLGKEFTDDFVGSTVVPIEGSGVSSTPSPRAGSSRGHATKTSFVNPSAVESPEFCNNNDVTPTSATCGTNLATSSTPIKRGFQPKSKTSPVLLDSADTVSTNFKTSCVEPIMHRPALNGTRQNWCGNDGRILYENGYTNSIDLHHSKKAPVSSHPRSSVESNDVENRNSAFLAEWNDDILFNPPPEKQLGPSPAVYTHTPEVVTRKLNRAVRQRRFPGPAGLLPPRQGNTSLIAPEEFLNELKSEDNDPSYQETEILSQSSGSVFDGGAWSAMLEDLGAPGHSLLKSMNLASIKAIGRNVRSYKVPFLSVLVQSIDASLPDAAVVFKDPTGEMHGVIHRDVWDHFSSDIAVGTVLVLRNVGIISAGVSSRKHVVNITGNNLTAIYSPKDELNIQLRRIHEFAASTSSKLLAEWEKVESQTANSASPVSRRLHMQPRSSPLFSGFQPGGGYAGSPAGASDSRSSNHPWNPSGSMSRPMAPNVNQRNGKMAPSASRRNGFTAPRDNQRNGPVAPSNNQRIGPMASKNNQREGPLASSSIASSKPTDRGLNRSDEPMDRIRNPSNAPNAFVNFGPKAASASSPFSPMLSRQSSVSTNQLSPGNTNKENSSSAGNKFVQKSPFTVKTPASARPSPQLPPNRFSGNHISNLTPQAPPNCLSSKLPIKKPKMCQNVASSSTTCQNSTTSKKNPFQVDADTSAIDSLLEGIDTDSLFGDF